MDKVCISNAKTCDVNINDKIYKVKLNTRLSDIFESNNINIDMPCSGNGKCGKCKIIVDGNVNTLTKYEKELLTESELIKNTRLACYTYVYGDVTVKTKVQEISNIATSSTGSIVIKNSLFRKYGLAIDIGTTTVAIQLYSNNGLVVTQSTKNPQTLLGSDVISRIEKSLTGNSNKLQHIIVTCINDLIDKLCQTKSINYTDIDYAVITGNTTMLYLLMCRNPYCLSSAPFEADYLFDTTIKSKDIGLKLGKNALVYLPKCISAFVGADITTAILSSNMLNNKKSCILVDIGTNGEIALWNENSLTCTSTAAGPAFEGSEISCGCLGIDGAIDKLYIENQKINIHTINNKPAIGICGSGLVDAVSALKRLMIIDETGAFDKDRLNDNLLQMYNDEIAFEIIDGIYITQSDIRKIQLAKSAICAGINTLMHLMNISFNNIDTIYIAGGFGNYMDVDNATYINLIPRELKNKIKIIGNAALNGAAKILCDKENINYINNKLLNVNPINLSTQQIFMDYYVDGMEF